MNICNMNEIGNINIHKHDGRYYLNIIAYDDVAERLKISDGLWTAFEISENLLSSILDVISQADYNKSRGHELDLCTINGTKWNDLTTIE